MGRKKKKATATVTADRNRLKFARDALEKGQLNGMSLSMCAAMGKERSGDRGFLSALEESRSLGTFVYTTQSTMFGALGRWQQEVQRREPNEQWEQLQREQKVQRREQNEQWEQLQRAQTVQRREQLQLQWVQNMQRERSVQQLQREQNELREQNEQGQQEQSVQLGQNEKGQEQNVQLETFVCKTLKLSMQQIRAARNPPAVVSDCTNIELAVPFETVRQHITIGIGGFGSSRLQDAHTCRQVGNDPLAQLLITHPPETVNRIWKYVPRVIHQKMRHGQKSMASSTPVAVPGILIHPSVPPTPAFNYRPQPSAAGRFQFIAPSSVSLPFLRHHYPAPSGNPSFLPPPSTNSASSASDSHPSPRSTERFQCIPEPSSNSTSSPLRFQRTMESREIPGDFRHAMDIGEASTHSRQAAQTFEQSVLSASSYRATNDQGTEECNGRQVPARHSTHPCSSHTSTEEVDTERVKNNCAARVLPSSMGVNHFMGDSGWYQRYLERSTAFNSNFIDLKVNRDRQDYSETIASKNMNHESSFVSSSGSPDVIVKRQWYGKHGVTSSNSTSNKSASAANPEKPVPDITVNRQWYGSSKTTAGSLMSDKTATLVKVEKLLQENNDKPKTTASSSFSVTTAREKQLRERNDSGRRPFDTPPGVVRSIRQWYIKDQPATSTATSGECSESDDDVIIID